MSVRIAVEAEHALPRFVLAPPLAALLGFEHDLRENITRAAWTYIRMHRLQVSLMPVLVRARLPPGRSADKPASAATCVL